MKPNPYLPILTLATGFLLTAKPVSAQMAEGLDTPLAPDAAAAAATPAAKKPEAAPSAEAKPIVASRYVSGDELPAYVTQLSARFTIRKRITDPFGRNQDPDFVAPQPKIAPAGSSERFRPAPPMPFSEVVAGISINTVIPGKQQFLIGNRSFSTNDTFSVRLPNGKQLGIKVVSVSSQRIRFRNVTTNETADLTLNMLPAGMQKGGGKIHAPGFEAIDSNAPVDIQPTVPLSNN